MMMMPQLPFPLGVSPTRPPYASPQWGSVRQFLFRAQNWAAQRVGSATLRDANVNVFRRDWEPDRDHFMSMQRHMTGSLDYVLGETMLTPGDIAMVGVFLTGHDDWRSIMATALHEFGHVLAPGDGHGQAWVNACTSIGLLGTRPNAAMYRQDGRNLVPVYTFHEDVERTFGPIYPTLPPLQQFLEHNV